MIKKLAFILVILFSGRPASAQSFVDTPRIITALSMNLAGDVDSVSELKLSVKVLEVGSAMTVDGDTTKVITIPDTALSILEERAWKFDKKGRLTSELLRSTDNKKGELLEALAVNYRFDKDRIENVVTRKEEEVSDSVAYVYSHNKISRQEQYDGKKKYTGRIQFFHNQDRDLSTISYKNKDLELIKMTKYWYDAKSKLESSTHHDNFQRLLLTRKYETDYDSAGRKHIKIFDYAKPDTCTGMTSYLLDIDGNHLEDVTQDARGNVSYYATNVYNDYGLVTEQVIFTERKVTLTFTYEYDEHKNWVVKRVYKDGAPVTFFRRTLFYRN